MRRAISPVFFVLAAACFFLPFFTVTCQGADQLGELGGQIPGAETQELERTYTGFQVATGEAETDLNEDTGDAPTPPGGEIPGLPSQPTGDIDLGMTQILAIVTAAVAIIGIVLSLMPGRSGGIMAAILGVVGAIALFVTGSQFSSAVKDAVGQQVAGFIEVRNEYGFWLSLVAFLVAAAWGVVSLLLGGRTTRAAPVRTGTRTDSGFGAPAAPAPSAPPPSAPPPTTPPPATPPPGGTPPPSGTPPAAPPPSEPPPPSRPEDQRP
jgi:hypothetical protein